MNETIELKYTLFTISISMNKTVKKTCIIVFMMVPVMTPIYMFKNPLLRILVEQSSFSLYALVSVAVELEGVEHGFL